MFKRLIQAFRHSTSPFILENEAVKSAMARVIDRRTYYGYSGHPEVRAFEAELSQMLGSVVVFGVNSGTDALIAALKLVDIGAGDEVIVPAMSFISTASAVSWVGATPRFADIRKNDFALDPEDITRRITPKVKAIIVAHLFGQPTPAIDKIYDFAKTNNIALIEDAAQSFGTTVRINNQWRVAGTIGTLGCLSFSSTKPLAAPGNGGALIVNSPTLYERADRIRSYGAKLHYFDYPDIGVNSGLHEIQAAALRARLLFLKLWLERRHKVALRYTALLSGIGDLHLPQEESGTNRIWYRYVIRSRHRNKLFEALLKHADKRRHLLPTQNYPVPLPHLVAFSTYGHRWGEFPVSEQLSEEVLSLPITNEVSLEDAESVANAVRTFFKTSA